MVILSVGVTPDTAFLQGSGIARNTRGSIEVTSGMETSVPDIYAVGDAVTVNNYITGIISPVCPHLFRSPDLRISKAALRQIIYAG